MRAGLGYLLYVVAIAITVLVVLAKFGFYHVPQVDGYVSADYANSLLVALVLALLSRWL